MVPVTKICSVHGRLEEIKGQTLFAHLKDHEFGDYLTIFSDWGEPVIGVLVPRIRTEGKKASVLQGIESVGTDTYLAVVEKAKRDGADLEAFIQRESASVQKEKGLT